MKEFLLTVLKARLDAEAWKWLQGAVAAAASGASANDALSSYTAASRRLGKQALKLDSLERAKLAGHNALFNIDHWGADEAGRAAILLAVAEHHQEAYIQLAQDCYELGDSREQQSWLRGLSVLPKSELFLNTAIDSCRTNIIPVFEAIACENLYPSVHFPELNFNQLVLKCLFNGIAMTRIIGLESRLNTELSRMADSYRSERQAAGRSVPADIWLVIEPAKGVTQ